MLQLQQLLPSRKQLHAIHPGRRVALVTRAATPSSPDTRSSSSIDALLAASHRLAVLDKAQEELLALCDSKNGPERQSCFEIVDVYQKQRENAQAGCARELQADGREGASCRSLNNLERLCYEVAFSGDAERLYHALKTQNNIAKRAAQGTVAPPPDQQGRLDGLRAKALSLFAQVDADGNGVIDREEFLAAMSSVLQHALSESELQLALSCMDTHGYITSDAFVSIVQAEALCDPAADAEVLRHVRHAPPSWWSDAPHCVTDV